MFSVTSVVETDVAAKECQCIFYRESEIPTFMSKKMPVSLDDKNWYLIWKNISLN